MKNHNKPMAVMAAILQAVLFFTFSAFIQAALTTQNAFDGVLEDVKSCRDSCDRTFPLHTYPKVGFIHHSFVDFVQMY